MDTSMYRHTLLRVRGEILSMNGIPPLRIADQLERDAEAADGPSQVEIQFRVQLERTDAKLLRAVEEALGRIDEGTYAICRNCEQPIPDARLHAFPWAHDCDNCKTK